MSPRPFTLSLIGLAIIVLGGLVCAWILRPHVVDFGTNVKESYDDGSRVFRPTKSGYRYIHFELVQESKQPETQ